MKQLNTFTPTKLGSKLTLKLKRNDELDIHEDDLENDEHWLKLNNRESSKPTSTNEGDIVTIKAATALLTSIETSLKKYDELLKTEPEGENREKIKNLKHRADRARIAEGKRLQALLNKAGVGANRDLKFNSKPIQTDPEERKLQAKIRIQEHEIKMAELSLERIKAKEKEKTERFRLNEQRETVIDRRIVKLTMKNLLMLKDGIPRGIFDLNAVVKVIEHIEAEIKVIRSDVREET